MREKQITTIYKNQTIPSQDQPNDPKAQTVSFAYKKSIASIQPEPATRAFSPMFPVKMLPAAALDGVEDAFEVAVEPLLLAAVGVAPFEFAAVPPVFTPAVVLTPP